jgi:hypothetical protein
MVASSAAVLGSPRLESLIQSKDSVTVGLRERTHPEVFSQSGCGGLARPRPQRGIRRSDIPDTHDLYPWRLYKHRSPTSDPPCTQHVNSTNDSQIRNSGGRFRLIVQNNAG